MFRITHDKKLYTSEQNIRVTIISETFPNPFHTPALNFQSITMSYKWAWEEEE